MSRAQQVFSEICERLGTLPTTTPAELIVFRDYPQDVNCPPMRPALIAQVAKLTGTDAKTWADMERLDLLDEVAKIDVDHIKMYKKVHLPIQPKTCLFCGSDAISAFRTLNYKQCTQCGKREAFNLKPDQEPLLGPSRNVTKGKKHGYSSN